MKIYFEFIHPSILIYLCGVIYVLPWATWFHKWFHAATTKLCTQQHGRTIQQGVEGRTLTKGGRDCFRTTSICHGVSIHVHWFNGIQTWVLWGQTYKINILQHLITYKFSISSENQWKSFKRHKPPSTTHDPTSSYGTSSHNLLKTP